MGKALLAFGSYIPSARSGVWELVYKRRCFGYTPELIETKKLHILLKDSTQGRGGSSRFLYCRSLISGCVHSPFTLTAKSKHSIKVPLGPAETILAGTATPRCREAN